MTQPTTLNRRRFLRMGATLPLAATVLPALASSAYAAPPAATGIPAVGYIDVPANVALLNINEYPSGPTPAAVDIMRKMAMSGNRYYMNETSKFNGELSAYHDLKPGYLTIYAGSSEVLHFTTLAFTSPTRSLVTADPTFEQTWRVAESNGAKVHKVPLKADYSYDMKAMVAADPNAGLYYVCNPNNPTGVPVKRADIEWLLANKAPGSIVLVDEAYIHFSDAESVIDLVGKDKDLIVSRTFSKIYSMGGLRFGYAMARPDLTAKLHFYNVNAMSTTAIQCAKVQLAGPAVDSSPQARNGRYSRQDLRVAHQEQLRLHSIEDQSLPPERQTAWGAHCQCTGSSLRYGWPHLGSHAELAADHRREPVRYAELPERLPGSHAASKWQDERPHPSLPASPHAARLLTANKWEAGDQAGLSPSAAQAQTQYRPRDSRAQSQ